MMTRILLLKMSKMPKKIVGMRYSGVKFQIKKEMTISLQF